MKDICSTKGIIAKVSVTLCFIFFSMSMSAQTCKRVSRPDWMKNLRDDIPACRVNMPGVHDGGTGTVHLYGASVQTYNVNDLLDSGVRVFDFRVGYIFLTELKIFHGGVDMCRQFKSVMKDCYDFVQKHNSEYCVIIVNKEWDAFKWKKYVFDHLKDYFTGKVYWENDKDFQHISKEVWVRDFRPDITVKEMRGKVLLLFRDTFMDLHDLPGIRLGGFPDGPELSTATYYTPKKEKKEVQFLIQDACNPKDVNKDYKKKFSRYIRETCETFTKSIKEKPNEYNWCINHASAFTFDPCLPNSAIVASDANREFSHYLAQNPETYTGMVMMDYAAETSSWGYIVSGDMLLEQVIRSNWFNFKNEQREPDYIPSN